MGRDRVDRERLLRLQEKRRVAAIIRSLPVKPVPEIPFSRKDLIPLFLDTDKARLSNTVRRGIAKEIMKGRKKRKKPLWSHWKYRRRVQRESDRRRREKKMEYKRAVRRTPRGAWMMLAKKAKEAGLAFKLTEDDFVGIWASKPGAWDRRGVREGCTCLVRKDRRKGWTKANTALGMRGRNPKEFILLSG